MKKNLLYHLTVTAVLVAFGTNVCAQTVIFDPSLCIPHDTGYYLGGYDKEVAPGVYEHFDSCTQEAQGYQHFESGIQNGFYYENANVMPTCESKNTPSDVSAGYVQLAKAFALVSFNTDTADLGQIISPPLTNLTEIYIEFSPDVTPNNKRHIVAWIQYSIDDGASWDSIVLIEYMVPEGDEGKNGDVITYDDTDYAFAAMKTASEAGPIRLKIVAAKSKTFWGEDPQRMRVHYWSITGTVGIDDRRIVENKPFYIIRGNTIIAIDKPIKVYNALGQLMGSGQSVTVQTGIYIVKAENGLAKKVYVNENVK